MALYLTSTFGGYYKQDGVMIPIQINTENGLLASLRQRWRENARVLLISSDPDNAEKNDSIHKALSAAFPMSGLSLGRMDLCDGRREALAENLYGYHGVILAGGHVPTQNRFFARLCLKERMKSFEGLVMGISAGAMNCAQVVYAQPELEGESIDPTYERFLPGLGLTRLMVLPHYQSIKDDILDGKLLFKDITYPDSLGREFYAIEDGSYFLVEGGTTTLYGAGYLIKDGTIRQICGMDDHIRIDC